MERLLTVEELSNYLSVSEDRIYQLTREGILPHCRLGRSLRYSPSAIQAFIEQGGKSLPGVWKHEVN